VGGGAGVPGPSGRRFGQALNQALKVFMDNAFFHRSREMEGRKGRGGRGGLRWPTCRGTAPI
jgi:hypothetical protein